MTPIRIRFPAVGDRSDNWGAYVDPYGGRAANLLTLATEPSPISLVAVNGWTGVGGQSLNGYNGPAIIEIVYFESGASNLGYFDWFPPITVIRGIGSADGGYIYTPNNRALRQYSERSIRAYVMMPATIDLLPPDQWAGIVEWYAMIAVYPLGSDNMSVLLSNPELFGRRSGVQRRYITTIPAASPAVALPENIHPLGASMSLDIGAPSPPYNGPVTIGNSGFGAVFTDVTVIKDNAADDILVQAFFKGTPNQSLAPPPAPFNEISLGPATPAGNLDLSGCLPMLYIENAAGGATSGIWLFWR